MRFKQAAPAAHRATQQGVPNKGGGVATKSTQRATRSGGPVEEPENDGSSAAVQVVSGKHPARPVSQKVVSRSTRSPRPTTNVSKKARRNWAENALKEIREYQRKTENLIPCAAMRRVVRQILHGFVPGAKMQRAALEAVREASEMYLVEMFNLWNILALHAGRVTIKPKDQVAAKKIKRLLNVELDSIPPIHSV